LANTSLAHISSTRAGTEDLFGIATIRDRLRMPFESLKSTPKKDGRPISFLKMEIPVAASVVSYHDHKKFMSTMAQVAELRRSLQERLKALDLSSSSQRLTLAELEDRIAQFSTWRNEVNDGNRAYYEQAFFANNIIKFEKEMIDRMAPDQRAAVFQRERQNAFLRERRRGGEIPNPKDSKGIIKPMPPSHGKRSAIAFSRPESSLAFINEGLPTSDEISYKEIPVNTWERTYNITTDANVTGTFTIDNQAVQDIAWQDFSVTAASSGFALDTDSTSNSITLSPLAITTVNPRYVTDALTVSNQATTSAGTITGTIVGTEGDINFVYPNGDLFDSTMGTTTATIQWAATDGSSNWINVGDNFVIQGEDKKSIIRRAMRSNLTIMTRRGSNRRALVQKVAPEEFKARCMLRDLITEAEYRRYLTNGFVMVKGKRNWYQVFSDQRNTRVYKDNVCIQSLCIHTVKGLPPTDHVINMKMLIEFDENEIWSGANKNAGYGGSAAQLQHKTVPLLKAVG